MTSNEPYLHCLHELNAHYETFTHFQLKDAFAQDKSRFDKYSLLAADLFLDYSKNFITSATIPLWCSLLNALNLKKAIEAYFSGGKINYTEDRAVLHTALRYLGEDSIYVDGHDVMPEIKAMRKMMEKIVEDVHSGAWRGYSDERITDVVNIGIGGSDLGPEMVYQALLPYKCSQINTHFISNLDPANLKEVLRTLSPKRTLFIIVSKSFTTQETLTNAKLAKKWMLDSGCLEDMTYRHFIAVSSQVDKAFEFGIKKENILPMWDWVGGRFSLWSAAGLSIALSIGMSNFNELLAGAYAMDKHFRSAAFEKNMPVILAILSAWYTNFFQAETFCLLPYSYYLRLLPSYLQQASMESLGKSVDDQGKKVNYSTGAILWGGAGTNTQHSFHQLLFQGTHFVPIDFVLPLSNFNNSITEELPIIAHCLGQSQLFMQGYSEEENLKELLNNGVPEDRAKYLAKYKAINGNSPSNMILMPMLSPKTLGSLVALYEHKIFVESVIWRINAYDQWGVERGKKLANQLLKDLSSNVFSGCYDQSTLGLMHRIQSEISKK